jgi:hypothetical protein
MTRHLPQRVLAANKASLLRSDYKDLLAEKSTAGNQHLLNELKQHTRDAEATPPMAKPFERLVVKRSLVVGHRAPRERAHANLPKTCAAQHFLDRSGRRQDKMPRGIPRWGELAAQPAD